MPEPVHAPFTSDQVASLNAYQAAGVMHPFTCGKYNTHVHDVLVAREDGWHCPVSGCDYTQDWAHSFMTDWSWRPDRMPVGIAAEFVDDVTIADPLSDKNLDAHRISASIQAAIRLLLSQRDRAREIGIDAVRRAEALDAQLGTAIMRLGQPRHEWGVRLRDDDPDEEIDLMVNERPARACARAWREEIEGSNPTVMVRTGYSVGPWRVADPAGDDDA